MLATVFPSVGFLKISCLISCECQGPTVIISIKKKKKKLGGDLVGVKLIKG